MTAIPRFRLLAMTTANSFSQRSRAHATSVTVDPADVLAQVDAAVEQVIELQTRLLDIDGGLEREHIDRLGRRLERLGRANAVCQAHYAGLVRGKNRASHKARTTDAGRISETTGCSRPEAFGHIDAARDLDDQLLGPVLRRHELSVSQAAGIRSAMHAFADAVPDEVIATEARQVIASAANHTRAQLRDTLMKALSKHLPPSDDDPQRKAHQHMARSAKLGEQQANGMSRLQMELPPAIRALFEGYGAKASATRATIAEQAAAMAAAGHRDEVPEVPSYEQAFFDEILGAFQRGAQQYHAGCTPRASAPDSAPAPDTSGGDIPTCDITTATESTTPLGSVVVSLDPRDLTNPDKVVATNSGAWITVAEALDIASRGSAYVYAYFGGKAHLFRVEEVDPDAGAAHLRFATTTQRLVLFTMFGGCVWPGCPEPAARCQSHHVKSHADGGLTIVRNLAPMCRQHHGMIHNGIGGYQFCFTAGSGTDPPKPLWIPNGPRSDPLAATPPLF